MKQLAEREHRLGNFTEAKDLYEQYLAQNPKDDDTWHALGILLAQCGQLQEAQETLEKAIAHNKNQATYHNSLGNVFRQLQQPDNAIKSYKQAIKRNTNYPIAYNNLGNIYFQQKRFSSAKQAYEKAILLKDNYADAYCNLGILHIELHEEAQAVTYLKKALSYNPTLVTAKNQLGDYYLRHDMFSEAKIVFSECIAENPHLIEAHHRLGIACYHLKHYKEAQQHFEYVLSLAPSHPEANQYLANTYLESRDHEKALQYYFRQLEKSPFYETYYNLGVLLMMKERFNEALLYFGEAEKQNSADPAIALNRGHIYLKRNQIDLAIQAYQTALRLKPHDSEIQHILAALTQHNTPEKAPSDFIHNLFNQYAPYYDMHLRSRLCYEIPEKIIQTITLEAPYFWETKKRILDLGCGTGLCGALLQPYASELIGVDLSSNMLAVAKDKNFYHQLIESDITDALNTFTTIELVVAGDVFTYIGELTPIFAQVSRILSSQGLFIFTAEKSFTEDYCLQKSVRYAHHKAYLNKLIAYHGFTLLRFDNIPLRKQKADWVEGYLVLLQKP